MARYSKTRRAPIDTQASPASAVNASQEHLYFVNTNKYFHVRTIRSLRKAEYIHNVHLVAPSIDGTKCIRTQVLSPRKRVDHGFNGFASVVPSCVLLSCAVSDLRNHMNISWGTEKRNTCLAICFAHSLFNMSKTHRFPIIP